MKKPAKSAKKTLRPTSNSPQNQTRELVEENLLNSTQQNDKAVAGNPNSDLKNETTGAEAVKKPASVPTSMQSTTKLKRQSKEPRGFLAKAVAELKMVEWPSLKYVLGWSGTIIIFTVVLGSTLGLVDYYLESSIQFVNCTSPSGGRNKALDECFRDLTSDLTFQDFLNRAESSTQTPNDSTPTTDQSLPSTSSPSTVLEQADTTEPVAIPSPENK